jgi:hypothetical protein
MGHPYHSGGNGSGEVGVIALLTIEASFRRLHLSPAQTAGRTPSRDTIMEFGVRLWRLGKGKDLQTGSARFHFWNPAAGVAPSLRMNLWCVHQRKG